MTSDWLRLANAVAHDHQLSFYDASWAAAARALTIPLVSADRRLVATGLAESPTEVARRLRLTSCPQVCGKRLCWNSDPS